MKFVAPLILMLGIASPAFAASPKAPDGPPPGPRSAEGGPGRHGGPGMRSPEKMFDMIDANHDGSITRAEFVAAHQRMQERWQQRRAEGGKPR